MTYALIMVVMTFGGAEQHVMDYNLSESDCVTYVEHNPAIPFYCIPEDAEDKE